MNSFISILVFVLLTIYNFCINNFFSVPLKGGSKENFNQNQMLNIYNEPLKKCGTSSMSSGSWDSQGKCSELGGGVHQICVKNIANNATGFSEKTGQSAWSDGRGKDNHCVCLGAWALYSAQKNVKDKKILKCDAIPKASLSTDYVSKFSEGWNKWNGLEMNNQIINGVESMVKSCYISNDDSKSKQLKKNYCEFAKKVSALKKTNYFNTMCN